MFLYASISRRSFPPPLPCSLPAFLPLALLPFLPSFPHVKREYCSACLINIKRAYFMSEWNVALHVAYTNGIFHIRMEYCVVCCISKWNFGMNSTPYSHIGCLNVNIDFMVFRPRLYDHSSLEGANKLLRIFLFLLRFCKMD